jgi:glucose uptake protein GlcU
MFSRIIGRIKSAALHVVEKQLLRASVAVPIVIGFGYLLAGTTATLAEHYGWKEAYWIMAGSMGLIAVIAGIVIAIQEHREQAQDQGKSNTLAEAATEVLVKAPEALARSTATPQLILPTSGGRVKVSTPMFLIIVVVGSVIYALARSDVSHRARF